MISGLTLDIIGLNVFLLISEHKEDGTYYG